MNKHTHSHCEHKLAWCRDCDIAYCTKCSREWGSHKWPQWQWATNTLTTPTIYYRGTTTGDAPLDVTPTITCGASNGEHAHA